MAKTKPDKKKLSPREEYAEALADLNRYSDNNETTAALKARQRFERAWANQRRRWWQL